MKRCRRDRAGGLDHQAGGDRLLHGREDGFVVDVARLLDDRQLEFGSHHRRYPQHAIGVARQARHPPADNLPDPFGDADVLDRRAGDPAAVPLHDGARLPQVAEDLPDEERIAFGLGVDRPGQREAFVVQLVTGGLRHVAGDRPLVEPRQREPFDAGLAGGGRRAAPPAGGRGAARCRGRCPRSAARIGSGERATWRSSNSVGLAAHCRSSSTSSTGSSPEVAASQPFDCVEEAVPLCLGVDCSGRGACGRPSRRPGTSRSSSPAWRPSRDGSSSSATWSSRCRSASTNGWNGTPRSSSQRPTSTSRRLSWTVRASSAASRVLPTPGSPASSTIRRAPAAASFHSCSRRRTLRPAPRRSGRRR